MGSQFSQILPPRADFTDRDLPCLKHKVFMITGGYSGVGFELAARLYRAGGKVYITGRDEQKAMEAIAVIYSTTGDLDGIGELHYLHLDLSNLDLVKQCAQQFLKLESQLDVLFHNAGTMSNTRRTSEQGYELQMAVHCLGPYLLTILLSGVLEETAAAVIQSARLDNIPASLPRVVWTHTLSVDLRAPEDGIRLEELEQRVPESQSRNYINSKTGNVFISMVLNQKSSNVIHLSQNPGNLRTGLMRNRRVMSWILRVIQFNPEYGVNTLLYAGLSPRIRKRYPFQRLVVPWGRDHPSPRPDITENLTQASKFVDWVEKQILSYK